MSLPGGIVDGEYVCGVVWFDIVCIRMIVFAFLLNQQNKFKSKKCKTVYTCDKFDSVRVCVCVFLSVYLLLALSRFNYQQHSKIRIEEVENEHTHAVCIETYLGYAI